MNEFSVFVLDLEPDSPFVYLLLGLFVVWEYASFAGVLKIQCFESLWKSTWYLGKLKIGKYLIGGQLSEKRRTFQYFISLDTLWIITNDFLLFFMNSIHSFIHQILNNCLNNKNIEKGANVINGPLWGGSFFYVVNTHSTKFTILTIFNYAIQWY